MSLSVSVIVPLFNHARYIAATLDSVLAQSLPALEIVVVDDGSQDDSAVIAAHYAARWPQIKVIRQANAGAHCALNNGIGAARGDLLAILNSDDTFAPTRLERCVNVFRNQPETQAVATGLSFMDDNGRPIDNAWYAQALDFYRREDSMELALLNGNFIMTTSNLLMRRALPASVGGFAGLRYAHDLEFLLRLARGGKRLHRIDENLVNYRIHARNTIKEDGRKVRLEWAACVAWYIDALFAQGDANESVWHFRERVLQVVEQHRLTGLVLLFLGYFAALPAERRCVDTFLTDTVFYRRMLALT